MRFGILFACVCGPFLVSVAQEGSGDGVYMGPNYVACLGPNPTAPGVFRFPNPNFDSERYEHYSEDQLRAAREAESAARELFRSIGELLCEGLTPVQINTSVLLPRVCVKVDAAGRMGISFASESVAESQFVSSALCHGDWTPEEINRRFLNPSGRHLVTDENGRQVIESLPEAATD